MSKQNSPKTAIYVGTFDPMTNGHLDVIERGSKLFEKLIVGVGENYNKSPFFTIKERLSMVKGVCESIRKNIEVFAFQGLAVDFARKHKVSILIRGLRTEADYVYEMQMAMMNRNLEKDMETIFIPTRQDLSHISSSIVKDVARLGGDVSNLVHPLIYKNLQLKNKKKSL